MYDPAQENPIEYAFALREDEVGRYQRDGDIHEWCGILVMNYDSFGHHGDSILMYNQTDGKPYLITGGIWETYWTSGGCDRFGVPVGEEEQIGFAKNLDKIGDITKTIKQASKRKFLAAREALVRIDGIGLELAFDGNGYVNYSDFTNKINELPYLQARKVIDKVGDLTPNEKAYNLIKAANGGSTKVLQYTYKIGKVVWLEEGNVTTSVRKGTGWKHIVEDLKDGTEFTRFDQLKKADLVTTKQDLKRVIFEIVDTGEFYTEIFDGRLRSGYKKIVGEKLLKVGVGENGYIVTITF